MTEIIREEENYPSVNSTQQAVDINNFKPISQETHTVLMSLYRSDELIKYKFLFYWSRFEFDYKKGDYKPLEREKEINKGTELSGFLNPESESGQAFAALDQMMRVLFELKESETITWYQIDGKAKIISANIVSSSSFGVRHISNTEQVEGGLTFDKITEADNTENNGNGLLEIIRDACFANLAGRDENDYPARIQAEIERQTAQASE